MNKSAFFYYIEKYLKLRFWKKTHTLRYINNRGKEENKEEINNHTHKMHENRKFLHKNNNVLLKFCFLYAYFFASCTFVTFLSSEHK